MGYLSVENFWKYQNADVWKKSKTHPPWFKHYVHRDAELDKLPPATRLLFFELLGAATRYSNVIEDDLNWLYAETRIDPKLIREGLAQLLKGGWLSRTKTRRRSRQLSRKNLPDSRDLDVDKEEEEDNVLDESDVSVGSSASGSGNGQPPDLKIPNLRTIEAA